MGEAFRKRPGKPASRVGAVVLLALATVGIFFYRYPLWFFDRPIYLRLWTGGVVGKYVVAGGNRLHFYEAGPASGQPVLLIHGLGSRGEDWSTLIPTFAAAGFHVFAPDLLGYGRSAQPDVDFSIGLEERVLVDFMQAERLDQADVIGWSMGGWVAMELALDESARVRRLAVYDTAGTYFPAVLPPGLFVPEDTAGVQRLWDILEPVPQPMPQFIARDTLRKLQMHGWVVERSLASMTGGRYLLDFRLGKLQQPMLILWGGADHLIPPAVGEALHRAVPQSRFEVVQGCGHLAPAECARPFLAATIAFLRAEPPLPPGEASVPKPLW